MYHMAVCDDDKVFISYIRKFLVKLMGLININIKFMSFIQERN